MATKNVKESELDQEAKKPKTCFVIMPISNVEGYPVGHFTEVYRQLIEPAVSAAGYQASLATSTGAAHLIQLEVVTKVATADLCICDLSTNNPNVMFEYGIRQAFDLPTVLIKDDKTRRIFDLSGFRDIEYDHTLRISNTLDAREALSKAIDDTVSASSDGSQIFSLVRLMQLTAASIPPSDLTKEDARFVLMEEKIDNLTRAVLRSNNDAGASKSPLDRVSEQYEIRFATNGVRIFDRDNAVMRVFSDMGAMTRDAIWLDLPDNIRERASFHFARLARENKAADIRKEKGDAGT